MAKKRIFITGAEGFIGANLTRKLSPNYDVHILSHHNKLSWRLKDISNVITTHHGDLTNFISLKKILSTINPDIIIHLATNGAYPHQNNIEEIVSINVIGTQNLLEASKNISYQCLINAGSSSEYGYKQHAMKETDICNPDSFYAITKLSATHLCRMHATNLNKPIVSFRLFSVYGPYEEATRFIPTIMTSLITKRQIKLTPGVSRRDFIYVDDVINAFTKSFAKANKLKGEVINLGTGKEHSNDEVVNSLFRVAKNKTMIIKGGYPSRTWDTSHWKANIDKARRILNWEPEFDINKGLYITYEWFNKNIKLYT